MSLYKITAIIVLLSYTHLLFKVESVYVNGNSRMHVKMERQLLNELRERIPQHSQYPRAEPWVFPFIIQILEVNEREGLWKATFVFVVYNEHRDFGWNATQYGITHLFVKKGTFWTPTVG